MVVDRTDRSPSLPGPELGEKEEEHWLAGLPGTYERYQPNFTHRKSSSWSRLDCVYSNAHLAFQLDRTHSMAALDWGHGSDHRPIRAERRTPRPRLGVLPSELGRSTACVAHTTREFQAAARQEPETFPMRKLTMIKDALHTARLMVASVAKRRACEVPLSGAAFKASQAQRTARYTTAIDMVLACPSLGRFGRPWPIKMLWAIFSAVGLTSRGGEPVTRL